MADATIVDPLGRRIVLHDATWYAHVLRNHRELAPHRSVAEAAIASPIEIRHSKSDPDCRLFYGTGPRPAVMMVVVANVVNGFVKTAYQVKKFAEGSIEWSKPTQ